MVSRCQKLLGMFLSFTQREEGQCAPVKVRVEPQSVLMSQIQLK